MAIDSDKREEPTDEEVQKWIDTVYQYTINKMANNGVSATQMKEDLINQGLTADDADIVVNKVSQMIKESKKENGKKDMLYGALWCIGGIVVTAITYSAASGGGTYIVAWGAIFWGAIQFIKGLINSFNK